MYSLCHHSEEDLYILNLIWAQFNVLFISAAFVAGPSADHGRGHPRVASDEVCQITTESGKIFMGKFLDISEAGFRFQTGLSISLKSYEIVQLLVPNNSLQMTAKIRNEQNNGTVFGCMFKDVDAATLRQIVNFTYCNPQNWKLPRIPTE